MNETEKALATWYDKDHPLHYDPFHPALGLAGEAGELLDLYKKERFKDGVSWWDCVYCNLEKSAHYEDRCLVIIEPMTYTPKVSDELGDLWYYLRILAYQSKTNLVELDKDRIVPDDKLMQLAYLNHQASIILLSVGEAGYIPIERLLILWRWFSDLLVSLDITLNHITELNWQKLKGGDNHGWKTARESHRPL